MVTKWQGPEGANRRSVTIVVESERVLGHGAGIAPALLVPISSVTFGDTDPNSYTRWWETVVAISGDILPLESHDVPLFSSGLQAVGINDQRIRIPINTAYLETLQGPPSIQNQVVSLRLRFALLLDSGRKSLTEANATMVRTETQLLQIPVAHWHERILPELGYPRQRVVSLTLDLPAKLARQVPDAQKWWHLALDRVQDAQRTLLIAPRSASSVTDTVNALRDAVDGCLRTWLCLWNAPPPDNEQFHVLLAKLQRMIPGCVVTEGRRKLGTASDAIRLCSYAIALHDLVVLTNPTHHIGTQASYSPAEADAWLLMVIGVVKALPELWSQFPDPLPARLADAEQTT